MKPHRVTITNRLVSAYKLTDHLTLYNAKKASRESLEAYHTPDYIDFLNNFDPKYHVDDISKAINLTKMKTEDNVFNLGDDW